MREIKLRAWDKAEKRMIYWKYLIDYCDIDYLFGNQCLQEKRNTVPDFEIMQYTGLKDKNGTEIYEGDIVRFDEELSIVRYDEETARFVLDDYGIFGCLMEYGWDEGAGGIGIIDTNGFDDFNDISEIQIIGNIYENPELLEWRE